MTRKKLMFICKCEVGHMIPSISIIKSLDKLYEDQFEFYFFTTLTHKETVDEMLKDVKNHNVIVFSNETQMDKKARHKSEFYLNFCKLWHERDIIKFNQIGGNPYWKFINYSRELYDKITKFIPEIKPDLIFVDDLMTSPLGTDQNIPYVTVISSNVCLFAPSPKIPPPRSGYPYIGNAEENEKLYQNFIHKTLMFDDYLKFLKEANDWLKEKKCPVNLDGKYYHQVESPYLNIYNTPKELDYQNDRVKFNGNWARVDSCVIQMPKPFPIPDKLKNLPGALVYFSLGSTSTSYTVLMNRLLKIFSELPYRFIVSTGIIGEEYELSDNQYGEKFVDQLAVLQSVKVFIGHGGNNSTTESCHFGVPMILLPLFGDQYNNAQRVDELGYGKRLDPFLSTKEEFEQAIEFCLQEDVQERTKKMSERIKKDNNMKSVCEEIVKLLKA